MLMYGLSGERRLQTFHGLSQLGLSAVFVSGLYGAARDELISRAKVVLNINLYARMRILEIVRVSYLLANKKAVVADRDANTSVEDDVMRDAVRFASSLKELLDLSAATRLRRERAPRKLEEQTWIGVHESPGYQRHPRECAVSEAFTAWAFAKLKIRQSSPAAAAPDRPATS